MKITFLTAFPIVFIALSLTASAQTGTVTIEKDAKIDALLQAKTDIEKDRPVYTIQIYSGLRRSDAEGTRSRFRIGFPKLKTSLEYESPNFKIWAGKFKNRLDADRTLMEIKEKFPNAFIIKVKLTDDD